METFRGPFEEHGATKDTSHVMQSNKGLVSISENSSERSSSVNSEGKIGYTLVLDLDETLVHYKEENNEGRVHFRPHLDFFLKEAGKNFELMIFTAA